MPRAIYGEFLRDAVMQATRLARAKCIDVRFIPQACTDIEEPAGGGTVIRWSDGATEADCVILASGRCPDVDVFGLAGKNGYFPSHMPGSTLGPLPLDAEIYVLGASLSAYDVVNELFAEGTGCAFLDTGNRRLKFQADKNERKVVLCSRSGRLKKVQSRFPIAIERQHFNASVIRATPERSLTLDELWALASADAMAQGFELDSDTLFHPYTGCANETEVNTRAAELLAADIDSATSETPSNFVVDYLDNAQFDIWDLFASHKLTEGEEARYRRDVESALLTFAAPCPASTARKILALIEAGRLRILHGITGVSAVDEEFIIEHAFGADHASHVINATGTVDRNVLSDRQPRLIRNLAKRGLLQPYQLNGEPSPGAAVDMQSFRCEGSRRMYVANMLLWGPGFFTSAAIVMATVIERMLRSIFDRQYC